jgi:hypothetical protein
MRASSAKRVPGRLTSGTPSMYSASNPRSRDRLASSCRRSASCFVSAFSGAWRYPSTHSKAASIATRPVWRAVVVVRGHYDPSSGSCAGAGGNRAVWKKPLIRAHGSSIHSPATRQRRTWAGERVSGSRPGEHSVVIDTNVTGAVNLLHNVGNDVRTRRSERMLITGSIAGFMPVRSRPFTTGPRH